MLLTAVSEAVERYDPSSEAAILLEVASGYQMLILSPEGYDYVAALSFRSSACGSDCLNPPSDHPRSTAISRSSSRVRPSGTGRFNSSR